MTLSELYDIAGCGLTVGSSNTRESVVFRFSPTKHPDLADLEVEEITSGYDEFENSSGDHRVLITKLVALVDYDEEEDLDTNAMFLQVCAEAQLTPEEINNLLS